MSSVKVLLVDDVRLFIEFERRFFERAGCSSRMLVPGDARALLGGTLDASGEPGPSAGTASTARLVRAAAPGAHPAFEKTPVVPPSVWQPLQNQRVRYFRKPAKDAAKDAGAPKPEDPTPPTGGAGPSPSTPSPAHPPTPPGGDSRGTPGVPPAGAGTRAAPETPKP
jgi:hypothetical protein